MQSGRMRPWLEIIAIRVEGKDGKEAMAYITDDCAKTLRRYLEVRAPLVIDGHASLSFTPTSVEDGSAAVCIACS